MVIKIIKKGNTETTPQPKATITPKVVKKGISIRTQVAIDGVVKGGKSKARALRDAGFSESIAKNPDRVFERPEVQEAIEPILARLIRHRDKVLERMELLVGTAGYTSLSITMANMNKDIELLSGRPTAREEHVLPEEEQAQLNALLEMNKQ